MPSCTSRCTSEHIFVAAMSRSTSSLQHRFELTGHDSRPSRDTKWCGFPIANPHSPCVRFHAHENSSMQERGVPGRPRVIARSGPDMTRLGGKVREEVCGRIRNDLAITERGFLSDASTIRHGDEITQTSSGGCGLELPIKCRRSWHGSIVGGRVDTACRSGIAI